MSRTEAAGRSVRILIDGHGGDHAPAVVAEAMARLLAGGRRALKLGVVGREDELAGVLLAHGLEGLVEIVPAAEVVEMHESPAHALRRKKESSMHVGARMLRDGAWDAFVSGGNTGALMAIPKFILKTLPGIDRPAIASMIPAAGGRTLMLDAGANVDSTSEHLLQFAIMGACYMQAAEGIEHPRIGLLNIGSEDIKGNDVVKVAGTKLRETDLNFIGNVESGDIFSDRVDVVVCDGFVGNVALKCMEGTAEFVLQNLESELTASMAAKAGMLFVKGALRRFKDAIHPDEYNGAPLLGLNGIVVKSHGSAGAHAFASAIEVARREVESGLSARIVETLNKWSGT